ncbi:MAG: 30S ribosome-binding factor RbfA [Candidatus Syntrophosphaera sp.]
MKSHRIERLQSELKKLLNVALTQKTRDPALDWVVITDVVISRDLQYAKIYFSHYNNPDTHENIRDHLIKTSGFLKKQIAGAHIMRTIPELTFYYDDSEDRAEKVENLLAKIRDESGKDNYDPDINLDDYLDEEDDLFDVNEDEEIYKQFIEEEVKEDK